MKQLMRKRRAQAKTNYVILDMKIGAEEKEEKKT